ncbi:hypothetical protein BT69DRAFT_1287817 [Atractiella rhizophila]|nr:hypothetical protein BT69DRAFT_1287817 [Atractiella rhizophila]
MDFESRIPPEILEAILVTLEGSISPRLLWARALYHCLLVNRRWSTAALRVRLSHIQTSDFAINVNSMTTSPEDGTTEDESRMEKFCAFLNRHLDVCLLVHSFTHLGPSASLEPLLPFLSAMTNLQVLSLDLEGDEVEVVLPPLPNLKRLAIRNCWSWKKVLQNIDMSKGLVDLAIFGQIEDFPSASTPEAIPCFQNIKKLRLSNTQLAPSALVRMFGFSPVQVLMVQAEGNNISPLLLAISSTIKRYDQPWHIVSTGERVKISLMPQLEWLRLGFLYRLEGETNDWGDMEHLPLLHHLRSLELFGRTLHPPPSALPASTLTNLCHLSMDQSLMDFSTFECLFEVSLQHSLVQIELTSSCFLPHQPGDILTLLSRFAHKLYLSFFFCQDEMHNENVFNPMAHALSSFLYLNITFDGLGINQEREAAIETFFYNHVHSAKVLRYEGTIVPNRTIFPDLKAICADAVSELVLEQMGVELVSGDDMLWACRRYGMER